MWQALTVRYNYGGNWTALFCHGSKFTVPAAFQRLETVYIFKNSTGYDGQCYHEIAHDPFFRRGFVAALDNPAMRYRRILVPGLAFLLAFGQDGFIDAAYILIVLASIGLGTYWLSLLAVMEAYTAAAFRRRSPRPCFPATFIAFCHPSPYPFGEALALIAQSLDLLALAGIAGALVWALYRAVGRA